MELQLYCKFKTSSTTMSLRNWLGGTSEWDTYNAPPPQEKKLSLLGLFILLAAYRTNCTSHLLTATFCSSLSLNVNKPLYSTFKESDSTNISCYFLAHFSYLYSKGQTTVCIKLSFRAIMWQMIWRHKLFTDAPMKEAAAHLQLFLRTKRSVVDRSSCLASHGLGFQRRIGAEFKIELSGTEREGIGSVY